MIPGIEVGTPAKLDSRLILIAKGPEDIHRDLRLLSVVMHPGCKIRFVDRALVWPNLIALSRCRVISVQAYVIEIEAIDAFPDTPVLDIKP